MKRSSRFILLVCIPLLLTGCASGYSKRQVLDSGSQVELRSYQTRSYDTTDKIRVLRSVMATLQDLGFVIDKADDVVGVVSATKLDGYALSMSVSVRPNGEQLTVRANAQYNLKAIEDPGPYQDFFSALDKGLFLDRNILADEVPGQAPSAKTLAQVVSIPSDTTTTTPAASIFDYYGEAEEEIISVTYDKDLWARALVIAEGDEQRRKARYIELRAQQLYSGNGPTASSPGRTYQPQPGIKTASSGQSGTIISSPSSPRASSTGSNVDLSGTYIAEITGNQQSYLRNTRAGPEFTIEQTGPDLSGAYHSNISGSYRHINSNSLDIKQEGDRVTGSSADGEWEFEGVIDGSRIHFKWFNGSNKGKGKFIVDAYGNLSGSYHGDSWGEGKWELTRIN